MKLQNTTNIPDAVIRNIVRATCPSGVTKFNIHVKNTDGGCAGMAYYNGCSYGKSEGPLVTIRVARTDKLAARVLEGGNGYLPGNWGSRIEALVWVIAHELRHLWQNKVKSGRRVWGARGQFSERDADAYGKSMLRKFRRGELGDLGKAPCRE